MTDGEKEIIESICESIQMTCLIDQRESAVAYDSSYESQVLDTNELIVSMPSAVQAMIYGEIPA